MSNSFRKITKYECGSTMNGHGNTCFFNSLKEGLKNMGHHAQDFSLQDFINTGGWRNFQKGKMVDSVDHADNLQTLALNLDIKIHVFTEVKRGEVAHGYSPFGGEGDIVYIVKLYGQAHFNLMEWSQEQLFEDEMQVINDAIYALSLQ